MKKTLILFGLLAFFAYRNHAQTTVTDIDGNVYNTVTIGTQVWMKENLKVTHYSNGDLIPNITDSTSWSNLAIGARCYYNNDSSTYAPIYGAIYNWYTANDTNLCPASWHVSTDNDWTILENYLGGDSVAGGKLKETGTNHWQSPNFGATNETGFTALAGGYRHESGYYDNMGHDGYWLTSTENSASYCWNRNIRCYDTKVLREHFGKNYGMSVRCLKNSPSQINKINYQNEINIYPNPSVDRVYINCTTRTELKMQVFNIVGKCVLQSNLISGENIIDISSLTSGVYLIRLTGAYGTYQKKMIKN